MDSRHLCALLGLGAVLTTGASLIAARPMRQRPPTFRAGIEQVEVDVAVTDANGRPVRGLTKDDFRIAGETITTFEEVSHEFSADPARQALLRLPHDVSDNRSSKDANLIILVVDDRVPSDRQEREGALARQIVDELGSNAQVGLLAVSGRLAVELTDDRPRLLAAIDRLRNTGAARVVRTTAVETVPCAFEVVEQAARLLASQPAQRKALISISPYCGADIKGAVDAMRARMDNRSEEAAVQMVDTMRRANVAFYAIDPRGAAAFSLSHFSAPDLMTRTPGRSESPRVQFGEPARRRGTGGAMPSEPSGGWTLRHFDPVVLSQENMESVATATGGFAVTNTNDLTGGVRRLVNDFDHYYLLGFAPADSTSTAFHKLTVLVDKPGAVLRYRRGYQLGGVRPPKNQPTVVTISGVAPTGDVSLRLLAMPVRGSGQAGRELVAIEVEAPRAALLTGDGSSKDDVTVTIAAVRPDQLRVEKAFSFDRHVMLPKGYAAGASSDTVTYQIVRAVDLPPASYQLRVSVKSARLQKTGSVYLSTDVPYHSGAALEISGPLVGYAAPTSRPDVLTLSDADLLRFVPVLERTFASSDRLRIESPLWRAAGQSTPVTARVDLLDEHGATAATSSIQVAADATAIDMTLTLAGTRPGAYRLRVTATSGSASAERQIGLAIR